MSRISLVPKEWYPKENSDVWDVLRPYIILYGKLDGRRTLNIKWNSNDYCLHRNLQKHFYYYVSTCRIWAFIDCHDCVALTVIEFYSVRFKISVIYSLSYFTTIEVFKKKLNMCTKLMWSARPAAR